mgnify:CR=1 FL=1
MKFENIKLNNENITIAILEVNFALFQSIEACDNYRKMFTSIYRNFPLILRSNDSSGLTVYDGREDIIAVLQN